MTRSLPTITVELVDGTKVVVPDSLDLITPYVLQEQGDWFEDEIRFLRRMVQPGQTVVDIGANYGVYALSLARRVGPLGRVWAFEPASATADLLAESIAANGTDWVELERQALSDRSGTAWLQLPGQAELNSLVPVEAENPADDRVVQEAVAVNTLDACLEEFGWQQVDLLKIDAEGEEERILAGGQRFFRELSPLVMFEVKAGAELHLGLVDQFAELGYACFRLVPGLGALMPFDPAADVDGYLLNLFAAKLDRVEALKTSDWLVPSAEPQPPEGARLDPYHWRQVLGHLHYGRALSPAWEQQERAEGLAPTSEALTLWAFSRDVGQPLDLRLGALQRSFRLLRECCSSDDPLPIWGSLTRVAMDLGERSGAVEALQILLAGLGKIVTADMETPFLPPCPRYEEIDPGEQVLEWLSSAALEAFETAASFSSFMAGEGSIPRLVAIQDLGFADETMERRLRLLRARFPRQEPSEGAPPSFMAVKNTDQIRLSQQAWDHVQRGEKGAAWACLRQADELGNNCPTSQFFRGLCLNSLCNRQEAITALQRAIELDPQDPSFQVQLGIFLKDERRIAEAEALLQQAVLLYGFQMASRPGKALEFTNLGIAYDGLGQPEQALEVLDQALQLEPCNPNALLRKGAILEREGRQQAAIEIFRQLLDCDPGQHVALDRIAYLLMHFGELDEARELLQRSLALSPSYRETHHMLAFLHSISGQDAVPEMLVALAGYWQQVRVPAGEEQQSSEPVADPVAPAGRIRLGVLTSELADHVVSLFLEPFLDHYDRQRFEVELIEGLNHQTPRADYLRGKADAVHSVEGLPLEAARRLLRSRGYQVIVETTGFTENSGLEILAERCATVQCHYIGYHASTGLDTIDWFIGDEHTAAAELAGQFVERLWRLPRLWLACSPHPNLPSAGARSTGPHPVLGSFNQFAKVREETLRFWSECLHRLPDAELHLKNFSTDEDPPRLRILRSLASLGIAPERIRFLDRAPSWVEHMACYQQIDVALDATPWSGATTTFEALSMGVPVVGIEGDTMASRMTASILRALGQLEWVSRTPQAFADIADALVADLPALRQGREALRRKVLASSLFDGVELSRHLECSFEKMLALPRRFPGQR